MSTITKERLEWLSNISGRDDIDDIDGVEIRELARIALASLEAEAVSVFKIDHESSLIKHVKKVVSETNAPPAPVSVPDEVTTEDCPAFVKYDVTDVDEAWSRGWNACRAAMLQGAEPVTTAYKLPVDFDFNRFNDVVWLEAVASNPHMHSPTTSTIAMVALELNRKLAAGNSPVIADCSCGTCRPVTFTDSRFVVCSECGNKRCPHANDHRNACTGSNEPRHEGSAYPAAPQQEANNG